MAATNGAVAPMAKVADEYVASSKLAKYPFEPYWCAAALWLDGCMRGWRLCGLEARWLRRERCRACMGLCACGACAGVVAAAAPLMLPLLLVLVLLMLLLATGGGE